MAPIKQRFVNAIKGYAERDGIDIVSFRRGERKADLADLRPPAPRARAGCRPSAKRSSGLVTPEARLVRRAVDSAIVLPGPPEAARRGRARHDRVRFARWFCRSVEHPTAAAGRKSPPTLLWAGRPNGNGSWPTSDWPCACSSRPRSSRTSRSCRWPSASGRTRRSSPSTARSCFARCRSSSPNGWSTSKPRDPRAARAVATARADATKSSATRCSVISNGIRQSSPISARTAALRPTSPTGGRPSASGGRRSPGRTSRSWASHPRSEGCSVRKSTRPSAGIPSSCSATSSGSPISGARATCSARPSSSTASR